MGVTGSMAIISWQNAARFDRKDGAAGRMAGVIDRCRNRGE